METKYPTLRRPKRKLCYLTSKESPKWTAPLTLEDIEKMFDDLDPSSHDNADVSPPSPLLQTFDADTNQGEREASAVQLQGQVTEKLPKCKMDPKRDDLHPATRSPSPKLDIDFDIPFKAHMPMKTSSPIEENVVVEEPNNEKGQVVSPVLFASDDQGKEKAKVEPRLIQKPQCNGHVTEESDDFGFESPPNNVVICKPQMSSHKKKVKESSKEGHPVKEKTPKKPKIPVLDSKRKMPRPEKAEPPVSAVRQEPELTAPRKKTEKVQKEPSVESTCVRKDMTAFLRQLREAGQPKPASSRTSLLPVKVPAPSPEPEDDFLILEDDQPLWISIPSKTATSKKQKQSRTSSSDKDSSADKGTNDSPPETAPKQQDSDPPKIKLGSQTVNQKTKKVKEKEKKNELTEPGNDKDELPSPEVLPAGDLMEVEKPNKKKQRLKKVPSKEKDKEEEHLKDGASGEEKPSLNTEKKTQKSSDAKRSTSLKAGNENAKTSRARSLKGGRKVMQRSDAVKQTMDVEAEKEQSPSSEERAEDLGPPSDKELQSSEEQTEKDLSDEKDKHKKLKVGSEGSSSEDSQTLGKRKRRQPGQWWLEHRITEESKVTDNQPTLKKSKQNNQESSAAAAPSSSPVKAKKDRVLKKRNTTRPEPSSSQKTDIAKEKKTKQNKNRNTRGDTRPDKQIHMTEAEPLEEQERQENLDAHSPLVLTHRGHSLDSGEQVFPKAYHHASNEKLSITPAPAIPRGPREQLRAAEPERRRRKPPGSWWMVDDMHENVESISSQQQPQTPKPRKERRKQSPSPRLGTPKNGNVAVSSKPAGGAPVPLLKMAPLSGPKTVKRSLSTFKDIFTSVTETPTACQWRRRKVSVRPAEDVTVTDCLVSSETDGGELRSTQNSPPSQEAPQESKCQSEDRLKPFRSGPSSMIELEEHEEDDDLVLMPPRVHATLSASDLCAAPLRPLILQTKDKDNLTEWFKNLWSTTVDKGAEVTPDQFDWYFYQGRAIGIQVDLNDGSFCNGKILLGSYMKKPLWVDHSATTVFNILTSSVSVIIDSKESCFHPGQSFMVPCGHAYSLNNVTAQPAVLYFTRMSVESSD